MNEQHAIREQCLLPAERWEAPIAAEVREILRRANLSGGAASRFLGMGEKGSRVVRRWAGGEADVPYSAWALLCHRAGLGCIWEPETQLGKFSG